MQANTTLHREGEVRAGRLGERWMMFADGADHRRQRAMLTPIFASRNTERMRLLVGRAVRETLRKAMRETTATATASRTCPHPSPLE